MPKETSKYRPEYCKMLEDHMEQGLSFVSFGGVVGVTENTLHNWKKKHEAFLRSYKMGLTKSLLYWEKLGRRIVSSGQGNAVVWIFNMKNRFKKQGWSDIRNIDKIIRKPQPLIPNNVHNNNRAKETT